MHKNACAYASGAYSRFRVPDLLAGLMDWKVACGTEAGVKISFEQVCMDTGLTLSFVQFRRLLNMM